MAVIISFSDYYLHRYIQSADKTVSLKGKRKRIKPKRQGDLDGLCGLYSVINAIAAVAKSKGIKRHLLFEHLLKCLEKDVSITQALLTGTYKSHVHNMLKAACSYAARKHDAKITIKPLFKRNSDIDVESYCKTLETFLGGSRGRCVLIGYRGRDDHWTVVYNVTEKALKLLDSDGAQRIRRDYCRIGRPYCEEYYHLIPTQAWGISLEN